jgi:hypothetical protein
MFHHSAPEVQPGCPFAILQKPFPETIPELDGDIKRAVGTSLTVARPPAFNSICPPRGLDHVPSKSLCDGVALLQLESEISASTTKPAIDLLDIRIGLLRSLKAQAAEEYGDTRNTGTGAPSPRLYNNTLYSLLSAAGLRSGARLRSVCWIRATRYIFHSANSSNCSTPQSPWRGDCRE